MRSTEDQKWLPEMPFKPTSDLIFTVKVAPYSFATGRANDASFSKFAHSHENVGFFFRYL